MILLKTWLSGSMSYSKTYILISLVLVYSHCFTCISVMTLMRYFYAWEEELIPPGTLVAVSDSYPYLLSSSKLRGIPGSSTMILLPISFCYVGPATSASVRIYNLISDKQRKRIVWEVVSKLLSCTVIITLKKKLQKLKINKIDKIFIINNFLDNYCPAKFVFATGLVAAIFRSVSSLRNNWSERIYAVFLCSIRFQ